MTFIIAQIIGVVGIILFVMCFHFKNMKGVLRIKFLMDIVWAAHYYLLGAVAGGISNTICSVREIIYMKKSEAGSVKVKYGLLSLWDLTYSLVSLHGKEFTVYYLQLHRFLLPSHSGRKMYKLQDG